MQESTTQETKPNKWFHSVTFIFMDYNTGMIDRDQFKSRLETQGFPDGYIHWLLFMIDRPNPKEISDERPR